MSLNDTEHRRALHERAETDGDQQPRVDRQDQRRQKTESRGVGGRRLVHRLAIVTALCAIGTTLVAWNALLVYAVAWAVAAIT